MLLRDLDLAEDAVQSTMLSVFRHWDRASSAPEPYSRQVLMNVCRDHWRRQARRPEELFGDVALTGARAPSFTDDVDQREALMQAIGQLPGVQQGVLILRFFFDLSLEDTAKVLEIPEGTVKSATHRGLQRLREVLSPPPQEAEAC